MCFIKEIYPLDVRGIFRDIDLTVRIFQFLNIDDDYLMFARVVLLCLFVAESIHQLIAIFHIDDMQATIGELCRSLFHQIKTIYEKVELGNDMFLRIIVGKHACGKIGECRLTGTLGMPYNSALLAIIYGLANSLSAE